MFQLAHLNPHQILPTDWEALDHALAMDYSGYTRFHLSAELDAQQAHIWQIVGADTRLLLVTEVVQMPSGKELHLRYLAGKGWFRHFDEILPLIEQLAAAFNCRFLTGKLRGFHAKSWYRKFGGKPNGVLIVKDLFNVEQKEVSPDNRNDALCTSAGWDRSGSGKYH